MPAPVVLTQDLVRPVALRVRPGTGDVLVVGRDGDVTTFDATTGAATPLAASPGRVATGDVAADGATVWTGGAARGVLAVPLDGSAPVPLLRRTGRPGALLADGTDLLVAEGRSPGRVLRVVLTSPTTAATSEVAGRGVPGARGLLVEHATGRTLVADRTGGGRLVALDAPAAPGGVGVRPGTLLADGLGDVTDAVWLDADEHHAVVADRAGRVLRVDVRAPGAAPAVLLDGVEPVWGARPLPDGRLVVGAGTRLLVLDAAGVRPGRVGLVVPPTPLLLGGWARIGLTLDDPTLTADDVEVLVEPQDGAAFVSASKDAAWDPAQPSVVLGAGWQPGPLTLTAVHRGDASVLGTATLEVLDHWSDEREGPARVVVGTADGAGDAETWGGPDAGDHTIPGVPVTPRTGIWRVGVVLVETAQAGGQYGADAAAVRADLTAELVTGAGPGGDRSVVRYVEQASSGALQLEVVGPVGPVALPGQWSAYLGGTASDTPGPDLAQTILSQVARLNEAEAAAGRPPLLDLARLDSVLYVIRSVPATAGPGGSMPRRGVWPRASRTKVDRQIGTLDLGVVRLPVNHPLGHIWMPDDWAASSGSGDRTVAETVAHELGHNLGLADQYDKGYAADVAGRVTGGPQDDTGPGDVNPTGAPDGSWELMAFEEALPLPSAAHRLMLGWLRPEHVRLYNFGVVGPVDEEIVLQAAGTGTVPPGRFAAAEVRVEDGRNLYLEYRPTVAGRVVDTAVPQDRAVVLTEALTRMPEPTDRPQLLLGQDDADLVVERGSYVVGEDHREQDTTTPGFEQEFVVDVLETTAQWARVRIRYASDQQPDPGILPWVPAQGWQSPDLEVVNGRSLADPRMRDVPWEGRPNTLRARVNNWGSSDARDVRVRFAAKDFTLAGGAETDLGTTTVTVPAGGAAVVEAPTPWVPAVLDVPFAGITYRQHSCVVARVDTFRDPVSGLWEVTPENNEAQSNYTWMASTTASPASREVTAVRVTNPYDRPAVVQVVVRQPHPLFRVYLDHAWLRLDPGEERSVLVMTESLLGDERWARYVREHQHGERATESRLRLSLYGDDGLGCAPSLLGGAAVRLVTGTGTRFERFEVRRGVALGRVVETGSGRPVEGRVVVVGTPVDPAEPHEPLLRGADLRDGSFRVEHGQDVEGRWTFTALYVERFPWAPCESEAVRL